jgi:ribonuclease P protein component
VRNRVKKHLREGFRSASARSLGGLDLVAIPRSAEALGETGALRGELDRMMRKAHRKLIGSAGRPR